MAQQHEYIKRVLELQLEVALPVEERCAARAARLRAAARSSLDEIRRQLVALHDAVGQLPPQLRSSGSLRARALGGDVSAAAEVVKNLPCLSTPAETGDCPICMCDLASAPDEVCTSSGACTLEGPSEADAEVVALSCGGGAHRFHRRCIRDWAQLSARCPLCRQGIGPPTSRCATLGSAPQSLTPPAPNSAERWDSAVEGEMSRLRSQSEGPQPGRSPTEEVHGTSSVAVDADEPAGNDLPRRRGGGTPQSSPNAAIASAAAGYGRALASAAMASASRHARAAATSAPGTSTSSTAPSTPASRPPRRPSSTRVQAEAHHVQQGAATRSHDAHVHGDILDLEMAASSQRATSDQDATRPRAFSQGPEAGTSTSIQNSAPPRPPMQVVSPLINHTSRSRQSLSPSPAVGDDSADGEPLSSRAAPTSRSNSMAPASSAAIATAATGYGRALASAAVASSLRRVGARPGLPTPEDGHAARVATRSSLALGGRRSMLARTGSDLLHASPSPSSREDSRSSSQPAAEGNGNVDDIRNLERRRAPSR